MEDQTLNGKQNSPETVPVLQIQRAAQSLIQVGDCIKVLQTIQL
jgi:hypothetical protein